ncbi:transposase [Rhizobium leguminosarum]|nr:transposase [Rhizobium leguminosarum]MBY5686333.1 transposase [Rhizobium leguminosarum]
MVVSFEQRRLIPGFRLQTGKATLPDLLATRKRRFKGVVLDVPRPGKPTDNSYIGSFSGKFRFECLNGPTIRSATRCRSRS